MVEYIRNTMNIKRLGVHGVSMGGLVATYLANAKHLDFLVADRTFASLTAVAAYSFHHVVSWIFFLLTWWNHSTCPDYLDTKCYKVTTYDPKDEVIPSLASLTYGLTSQLLKRKYVHDHERLFSEGSSADIQLSTRDHLISKSNTFLLKKYPFLGTIANKLPFTHGLIVSWILRQEASNYVDNYYLSIISTNDYNILFFALKRIFNAIIDASKVKSKSGGNEGGDQDEETEHGRRESIANVSFYKQEMSILNAGENILEDEDHEAVSEGKTPLKEMKMLSSNEEEYRLPFENEEDSEEIRSFVINVFSLMELIDSAGGTLDIVFGHSALDQNQLFKMFLVNLEIWGSWLPVKVSLKPDSSQDDFFHKLALVPNIIVDLF